MISPIIVVKSRTVSHNTGWVRPFTGRTLLTTCQTYNRRGPVFGGPDCSLINGSSFHA